MADNDDGDSKPVRSGRCRRRPVLVASPSVHTQVGTGLEQWLRRERVAASQAAGSGSASSLRAAFRQTVGAPPSLHWRRFEPAAVESEAALTLTISGQGTAVVTRTKEPAWPGSNV